MMLADISIDPSNAPEQIKSWLECLAFVGGLIYLLILIYKELRGKPAKPGNTELEQALTNLTNQVNQHIATNYAEHRDIHLKIVGVEQAAATNLKDAISSGNVSREKLHGRMNLFGDTIGALRGQMEILIKELRK